PGHALRVRAAARRPSGAETTRDRRLQRQGSPGADSRACTEARQSAAVRARQHAGAGGERRAAGVARTGTKARPGAAGTRGTRAPDSGVAAGGAAGVAERVTVAGGSTA